MVCLIGVWLIVWSCSFPVVFFLSAHNVVWICSCYPVIPLVQVSVPFYWTNIRSQTRSKLIRVCFLHFAQLKSIVKLFWPIHSSLNLLQIRYRGYYNLDETFQIKVTDGNTNRNLTTGDERHAMLTNLSTFK